MTTAQTLVSDARGILDWVAVLGNRRVPSAMSAVTLGAGAADLCVAIEGDGGLAQSTAQARACGVLFDGVLYNRADLASSLGVRLDVTADATLLLHAYERWGVELTRHIKGIFAFVIWDGLERRLLAVRDPLGAFPLFYAKGTAGRLLLSTSIDRIVRHPSVDASVNRAALADHLAHRWPYPAETFYSAVSRIPGGCRLLATPAGTRVERYWDPVPPGEPVNWVTEKELESFDDRLETAVQRAMGQGRSGIFLSGGLDSIAVAAIATDLARRSHGPAPIALSLGFPPPGGEEPVQRGVATSLGIEQEFVPFGDATPSRGLLASVLDYTRASSSPILNAWHPAYTHLTVRGKRRGVEVILSGAGGDEWLTVSPYLAADLLRSGDLGSLSKFLTTWQRSYRMSPWGVVRGTFWTFGVRPVAGLALHRIAPKTWHANRLARLLRTTRPWVAPDPELRKELDRRTEDGMTPAAPAAGFYFNEIRTGLGHALTSMELEEIFEMGRRLDVRFLHPYWDADVVDMLYRAPPLLLNRGGRAKGMVRETAARRFPTLGLDRQKKLAGTTFFRSVLRAEIPKLWQQSGGAPALAAMGIIDRGKSEHNGEGRSLGHEPRRTSPDLGTAQPGRLGPVAHGGELDDTKKRGQGYV